jgi:hypothetical protein
MRTARGANRSRPSVAARSMSSRCSGVSREGWPAMCGWAAVLTVSLLVRALSVCVGMCRYVPGRICRARRSACGGVAPRLAQEGQQGGMERGGLLDVGDVAGRGQAGESRPGTRCAIFCITAGGAVRSCSAARHSTGTPSEPSAPSASRRSKPMSPCSAAR